MANRRMIASDTFEDNFIGDLTYFERLLWIGLITSVADDQGRLMDNPALIRSKVFLFDSVLDAEVENALRKINVAGRIARYTVGNKSLIQIVNWWKYQSPSWANPSKYSAPDNWIDRAKYHTTGNKIISINWEKQGGYIDDYIVDYVPGLDSPIEERREEKRRGNKNSPPALPALPDLPKEEMDTQPFGKLLTAFTDATGIPETHLSNQQKVVETVDGWIASGFTCDEIKQAVKELQDKKLSIAGPWSITNALSIVRSKNGPPHKEPIRKKVKVDFGNDIRQDVEDREILTDE